MAISCDPQNLITAARCFFCVKSSAKQAVKTYLLCQYASKGSSPVVPTFGQTVANAWAAQVVANGGAMPSQNSINAAATFVDTLNNAGVWTGKLLDVNMFAPDSLTACLTPILVTDGAVLWTNNNFVGADLDVTGLQGNGSTKFINTGIDPNTRFNGTPPAVFPGLTYYVAAAHADGSFCEMSWIQNNWSLYCSFGGTMFYDCMGTGSGRISVANATWAGFLSGSRTSFANSAAYKASSTVPFAQIASTGADNQNFPNNALKTIFVFANNNGANSALQWSPRKLSFAAYHFGLSQADTQTLYNAVQALRVAFGGGFA